MTTPNEDYNKFLQECNKRILSNIEAYDKAVLYLSNATIGATYTLLHFFYNIQGSLWLVYVGVVILFVSICVVLSSFFSGIKANEDACKYAKEYYINHLDCYQDETSFYTKLTKWLNRCGLLCYLLGAGFVMCYFLLKI